MRYRTNLTWVQSARCDLAVVSPLPHPLKQPVSGFMLRLLGEEREHTGSENETGD